MGRPGRWRRYRTANGTDPLSSSVAESLESPAEGSFDITVYSGETVSFGETFDVPADADLFTTTLVCDGDASANDTPYSGSYVVPADPQDDLHLRQLPQSATLTLEKS
ncbi:MAG: hypothetical protein R2697_18550 [Ilumatobacteraceae bacterium]